MAKTEAKSASGEDQSMEEILQSIRRIIAEEGEGETPASAPVEEAAEDVLELTDVVTDNGAVVNIHEMEPIVAMETPNGSGEIEFEPIPVPDFEEEASAPSEDILQNIDAMIGREVSVPAVEPEPEVDDSSLLSPSSAEATAQALKNLRRPPAMIDGLGMRHGVTIEDIVVESLKPVLKEWLDKNLPIMVERIVEREIRKLT